MNNKDSMDHLSDEVLIKTYNSAKGILIGFIFVFVALIAVAVYITMSKGFGVFSVMPIVFISVLMGNITNFMKIKAEMKTRGLLSK